MKMNFKELNPLDFGLGSRVKLVEISSDNLGIVKKRKSRIIMKDGNQILEIAEILKKQRPETIISLIVSGPVCSKTTAFLSTYNINVLRVE